MAYIRQWGLFTEVTDADLDMLMQNEAFTKGIKDGFFIVDKKKVDTEKHAVNMNPKDGSAPMTPKDFEESENSAPDAKIF